MSPSRITSTFVEGQASSTALSYPPALLVVLLVIQIETEVCVEMEQAEGTAAFGEGGPGVGRNAKGTRAADVDKTRLQAIVIRARAEMTVLAEIPAKFLV